MAKKKRVRRLFGYLFNFKSWLSINHVKSGASFITTTFQHIADSITTPEQKSEQFEQAVQDQGLTEADIEQAKKNYLRNAIILLAVGLLFSLNSVYLIYQKLLLQSLVSFAVTIMIFVFSLKSHFWFFQIKNRKLGCSLREWYNNKVT